MTLKVIGTGFGRTGTDSMRAALEILGFRCHHMSVLFHDEARNQKWREVAKGATPDWDALFDGYEACVDWPSASYWPELIARYPEAKVILTWRSADSWWKSFENTILKIINEGTDPDAMSKTLIHERAFSGRSGDSEHVKAAYRANIEMVLENVPPGRLLVHRLGDGWIPLCNHLGVAVPDQPYPRGNTTADFQSNPNMNPLAQG